jgi:NAD(P)H-dependent flavin oxidoreductase YrpB (nitropropane dioxygenase family)
VLFSTSLTPDEKKERLSRDFHIAMTRELESEVQNMCNLSQGIWEQGQQQGIAQGILSSIQNLMDSMGWSAEQAMNALKIPQEERNKYANEVNKRPTASSS